MRIISGTHKGRRIQAPKNLPVRPTTDMAKEGLFNILQHRVSFEELSVLDLYAGTGNISYEFASRGSTDITAVDADARCIKFIQVTSNSLNLPIRALKSSVGDYIAKSRIQFDLIFADPPYELPTEEYERLVQSIFQGQLLKAGGVLVIEHSRRTGLEHLSQFSEKRKYGSSEFSFFNTREKGE